MYILVGHALCDIVEDFFSKKGLIVNLLNAIDSLIENVLDYF